MAENQVSRIQHRNGPLADLSGVILNNAEIGLAVDEGRVFIGTRTDDGASLDENIELITENTPSVADLLLFDNQTGTTYTLEYSDIGKIVEMENAGANTLTVPPASDVSFPVGTKIEIIQQGAGTTTVAAGAGVTINSAAAALAISARYGQAALIKRATDVWTLYGDLA